MIEHTLDLTTTSGATETFVCRPERGGPFPPVFMLMDAPGIREELRDMARRLATVGYYVLLPNLYYRAGRDTKYGPDVLTRGSADHARMRAVRTKIANLQQTINNDVDNGNISQDAATQLTGELQNLSDNLQLAPTMVEAAQAVVAAAGAGK